MDPSVGDRAAFPESWAKGLAPTPREFCARAQRGFLPVRRRSRHRSSVAAAPDAPGAPPRLRACAGAVLDPGAWSTWPDRRSPLANAPDCRTNPVPHGTRGRRTLGLGRASERQTRRGFMGLSESAGAIEVQHGHEDPHRLRKRLRGCSCRQRRGRDASPLPDRLGERRSRSRFARLSVCGRARSLGQAGTSSAPTETTAFRPEQARRGPTLGRSHSGESGRVASYFPRIGGKSQPPAPGLSASGCG
jgi:hypothetical protein